MWMVDPSLMCRQHLLGEHGELHKFLPSWKKHYKIDRRIDGNAIEPKSYKRRHEQLVKEMIKRNYNHNSPLIQPNFDYLPKNQFSFKIDKKANYELLTERCPECRRRQLEDSKK